MASTQQSLQSQQANSTATISNLTAQQRALQNQLSQVQASHASAVQQHGQQVASVKASLNQTIAVLQQQAEKARTYQANLNAQLQAALNMPRQVIHIRRRLF